MIELFGRTLTAENYRPSVADEILADRCADQESRDIFGRYSGLCADLVTAASAFIQIAACFANRLAWSIARPFVRALSVALPRPAAIAPVEARTAVGGRSGIQARLVAMRAHPARGPGRRLAGSLSLAGVPV